MLSAEKIKFIRSLHLKKYREEHKLFIVEGEKSIKAFIEAKKFNLCELFLLNDENFVIPSEIKSKTTRISYKELERISNLETPSFGLGVFHQIEDNEIVYPSNDEIILALDNISDPGNLGTIIRTAAWFGTKKIILSHHSVEIYSPKVIQASMGAINLISFAYSDLLTYIKNAPAYVNIYATTTKGKDIRKSQIIRPAIIIIGNESKGINAEILKNKVEQISICSSSKHNKIIDSLNAAIATAIVLFEATRKV